MKRLLRTLLVALLLGPSVGQALRSVQDVCAEERQGCCETDGVCDDSCVDCACCAPSAVSLANPTLAVDLSGPPVRVIPVRAATPPAVPPSDILKVPKSA